MLSPAPNIGPIALNLSPSNLVIEGQDFGRKALKFVADGAVLVTFGKVFKNLSLKDIPLNQFFEKKIRLRRVAILYSTFIVGQINSYNA